jgi:hypothetical protein
MVVRAFELGRLTRHQLMSRLAALIAVAATPDGLEVQLSSPQHGV